MDPAPALGGANGFPSTPHAPEAADLRRAVRRAEASLQSAQVTGSLAAFAHLLDPGMLALWPGAAVRDRETYVRFHRADETRTLARRTLYLHVGTLAAGMAWTDSGLELACLDPSRRTAGDPWAAPGSYRLTRLWRRPTTGPWRLLLEFAAQTGQADRDPRVTTPASGWNL